MVGRPSRADVYRRLDEAVAELRERTGGLPAPAEAEGIWTAIWFEEAHNSTAIEGNTLVLKQVERLLADGVAVGNHELREYLEVRGYAAAAQWVYGHAIEPGPWTDPDLLNLQEVRQVHAMALGVGCGTAPCGNRPGAPGQLPRARDPCVPGGHDPTVVDRRAGGE